jgi:hypothetical protein
MILCEKPLAMNPKQAEAMVKAVEKAKVPNMVWYNYRRCPAVVLAKNLIDAGKLGRVFHYRANFLQDWTINPELPQGGTGLWRLDVKVAGSGVTGDLLAHCIDTALWLNGGIKDVSAMTETFVKERKHTLTGKVEKVGIDDACLFHCRFNNGSLGLFESTRYARGHKALYTFEINGEHMSLKWDLHDLHRLQIFDHSDEGRSAAGRASTSPTATTPTAATGGCPASSSVTNTASSTPWWSSSRDSKAARAARPASATVLPPTTWSTPCLPPPRPASGSRSSRPDPRPAPGPAVAGVADPGLGFRAAAVDSAAALFRPHRPRVWPGS